MAFADTDWIELRPITLLFGKNSSGKSAIIRALRLLRQSLTDAPGGSPFAFFVEDGVDVGDFLTMAHGDNHDRYTYSSSELDWETGKATVGFGFRLDMSFDRLRDFLPDGATPPYQVEFELHYGFQKEEPQLAFLKSLSLRLQYAWPSNEDAPRVIFMAERFPPHWIDEQLGKWYFDSDLLTFDTEYAEGVTPFWRVVDLELRSGFLPSLTLPEGARGEESRLQEYEKGLLPLMQTVTDDIARFLGSIEYVRPIRPDAQRFYMLDDAAQSKWKRQGLGAFLRLVTGQLEQQELSVISEWVKKLRFGVRVVPRSHFREGHRAYVTSLAIVESDKRADETNLADMGYGVAQILPIIAQSLLGAGESVTCIEQPELHLHPDAQAKLADMFIEAAERNACLLIETHSEHLVLRIQRRARKQRISADDVWVAYTTRKRDDGRSYVHRLRMNKDGEFLDYWPEGFFPERSTELFDLEETQEDADSVD